MCFCPKESWSSSSGDYNLDEKHDKEPLDSSHQESGKNFQEEFESYVQNSIEEE